MDTIEQIKNHIAKGETDKAIALLVDYTKKTDSPKQDDAILLSGQYRQWKREISLGVEQSSSELRRIEMTILDILQEKKRNADVTSSVEKLIRTAANPSTPTTTSTSTSTSTSKEKNKMTPILLGIIGIMILGFSYVFLMPDNHAHEDNMVTANDSNMVTGIDLQWVSFGSDADFPVGYFKQEGTGNWAETGPDGVETKFTFIEVERNESSVYLLDESRNMEIHLDLYDNKVLFSDNGAEEQILGDILTWGN